MRKRILSILLCIAVLTGLLPTTATAANDTKASILGVQLQEGYYSTKEDYTRDDGTFVEGTTIDMGSRSDTAPEGRNNYLYYQDGVLTIHGKVFVSSSNNSPVHVSSGSLTVRGSGILYLYGMDVPALIVSTNAKIDFALTPNDSNEQLHISSNSCAAVRGDLTVSSGGRIVLSTSDFLNEGSTDVYNTIDGNADIQVESLLLHNETGGACINGNLTVKAEKYCQIINQSEDQAALTGGKYWIETSDLNMQSYCGPLVNGDLTCKGVESTDDLDGKLSIVGCTIGETPVVRGNITVLGGSLYLGNQNYFRDTTDERYTQFKDNMADGPILVGDLTLKNAERLNVSRKDAGTTPLITGDVTLIDCFGDGMNAWDTIDRGTGTGPAIKGNVTLNNSRLGISAESSNDYEINDAPGLVDCKLSMTDSILTVYSRNNDIIPAIDQLYEWYVDNYVSSKPVFTKSTVKPYTTAESTDYTSLMIRSGDKMGFRAAKLGGGYITGTALQPVTMTTYLIMEGDNFDFREVPGYQEIVTQEEWGDHKGYGIPTGTDLTDYLTLDKPQGGIWKLTTAENAYQDDTSIQLTISGTAGGTNCSDPVTLTISGTMLDSGEDLAVSPSKYTRWNITGSTTQAMEYDLWVYGVQVTSRNQTDILNNGMASFDPQANTLFLKNADLQSGIKDPVIKSELDALTLSVTGQNTLCCLEGVVIDAKRLTVMPTDATSSLTIRSDQVAAFARDPILPNEAEIWSGDSVDGLAYTLLPNYTASKCIKITLHEMQTTWTYDSNKHWYSCFHAGCPQKVGVAQHVLQWVIDTPAISTTPGWRHQKCSICAYTGEKVELPCIKPIIDTESLPSGTKNLHYSALIKVIGAIPFHWSLVSGNLPKGLTLDSETGEIRGTPTELGTFVFTLKVTNAIGEDSATYRITVERGMDISGLFTEKKTGCTNGSKDISAKNGTNILKQGQQYDFLYAAIRHSMRNTSQAEFDAVAAKLYDVLFTATYRPICFGATKDTIATWPHQNVDKDGKGVNGTSVTDTGLGPEVHFASSRGCASYAHFVSNYVYGKDGTSSYSQKVRIKSDAAEFKKYFEANVDPGETINYDYRNGRQHWIVFLGESEDEQGFYYISYEGGRAKNGGPYNNLNVGYWTYSAFASHADNKSLSHWDTNKGSFSSGKYTALKIVSHCPVEMIVSYGDEALDSRGLNGSKTTSLGTMTATGEGADRSVTVELKTDVIGYDLTLLGTDNGTMDLTVTHTYEDENGEPQSFTHQYAKVPVLKGGQITGLIPVDGAQTIQLDVPDPTAESGMVYWLANPGDTITGPEEGYHPYNPDPDDNEPSSSSSGSSGGSPASAPSTVTVEDAKNGHVTISPETASKGDTVTVTVRPDTGYMLGTITVTDQDGKELALTDMGNGTFTFPMPASRVMVKAVFQLITFTDVPGGSYYEEAIKWATDNAITKGMTDTTFGPDLICTRAQAVTFLWRAAGSPVPQSTDMPFTDVPSSAYYHDAVLWAVENGITTGTSAATFSPDATCSRAQIVTLLWRAQSAPTTDGALPFTDVADDAYYADAVLWAVTEEVTKGTSDTTFSPDADCTRAQIVTFLWRALK